MKVLLTGITGFVGQALLPRLLTRCSNINYLTLNIDINEANEKYPYNKYTNYKHIHSADLDEVVKFNPDIVFHLAAMSTSRNDRDIIKPLLAANIEFGVLLLESLSHCSNLKLFVNTGSFAEYRLGSKNINNAYLYSATKTAFRSFVDFYSDLTGYKYITVVPYTIYGGKSTVKRLMDFIFESLNSEIPIDMTNGEQVLDFINVNDVASFFVQIIDDIDLFLLLNSGEEFHLGTGKGTSIKELVQIIEKKTGRKCNINWGGLPYRDKEIMYAVAPINKKSNIINWKPSIGLEQGLEEMLLRYG